MTIGAPMIAAGQGQFMIDQRPRFDNAARKRRKRRKKKKALK